MILASRSGTGSALAIAALTICSGFLQGASALVLEQRGNFDRRANTTTVQAPGFTWGSGPMRGVNVGGWLVLEPWITPSIFETKPGWVVDEWTYGQYMRTQNDTYGEIQNHWGSWFQYTELEDIARVGLNTIRIQVGFWSCINLENGEPYLVGAWSYLQQAVSWASSLGLKVMIDLHGAPGSQNGFDNSGLRGTREWFTNSTNLVRTLTALQVLTHEFTAPAYGNAVIAIELINEPFPYTSSELAFLQSFYTQAYATVRASNTGSGTLVVALDDGYQGLDAWTGFMTVPNYYDVAMDTHIYSMFDNSLLSMGYNDNLDWTCSQASYLERSNQAHWTICGEWTPANTDCAKWLNGRGQGARFDNTLNGTAPIAFPGDCNTKTGADPSKWDAEYTEHLARSFEAQTYVYESSASGWIMWTWKTEQAADWSLQTLITYGVVPYPITARRYGLEPCKCGKYVGNTTTGTSAASPSHVPTSLLVLFVGVAMVSTALAVL